MSEHRGAARKAIRRFEPAFLPSLVFIMLGALVLALWSSLEARERTDLGDKVRAEAEDRATHVGTDLSNRVLALQRMVDRWVIRGSTPKEEFLADAGSFLEDTPGFQAIEWVDKDFIVRWIVPLEGNERAQDLDLAFEKNRRTALERAKTLKSPTATAPIDLVQGGKGFLIYFPIYVRDEFNGFILAVFRVKEWLDFVFDVNEPGQGKDFRVEASLDAVPIYKQEGWDGSAGPESTAYAGVLGRRLAILVRPTAAFIGQNRTPLPSLTAATGFLFSALVAFIVRLFQKARMEAETNVRARAALEEQARVREKAEGELETALSRLDMATKAGGIGVWTWDIATGKLEWNERMYALYGIPEDVVPRFETWRAALHPEDRSSSEALLRAAVEGTGTFNTEFRIVTGSGAVRYLGAAARVARDREGRPLRVSGINWDLTTRKEAEEAVKRSEERVRLLLDSTAEAIYGIDLQGDCTFANPSCVRMLGYSSAEQLLGQNMHSLCHHSYADGRPMPVEDCSIFKAFRKVTGVHREDEVLWRSDGTSFPAEYWSFPQVSNGRAVGAVVTFNDITERKRAEEALAAASRDLEARVEERTQALTEAHDRIMAQRLLQNDLETAGQIQANLLTAVFPVVEGFEFAARAKPSRYVNGDFYDCRLVGGKYCSIMLADIAGKGLPAALIASSARSLYRLALDEAPGTAIDSASRPEAILRLLNKELLGDLELAERFITMISARLDLGNGDLELATAGGCKVILFDGSASSSREVDTGGLPIGLFPDLAIEPGTAALRPGMGAIIYSDGITEAVNPEGELFGVSRLLETASRRCRLRADGMATAILAAVDEFRRGIPLADDVTLIVLAATPRRLGLDFSANAASVDEMPGRIGALCRPYGEAFAGDIELALSEVITNIWEHGYGSGEGPVSIDLRLETRGVELLIKERGRPFDIGAIPPPALGELEERGRGLFLIRKVTDNFSYQPGGADGNLWIIFKSL